MYIYLCMYVYVVYIYIYCTYTFSAKIPDQYKTGYISPAMLGMFMKTVLLAQEVHLDVQYKHSFYSLKNFLFGNRLREHIFVALAGPLSVSTQGPGHLHALQAAGSDPE